MVVSSFDLNWQYIRLDNSYLDVLEGKRVKTEDFQLSDL